ncbi:histidinol-phosphatase [Paenibacillus sp. KN14-4R]|uniref:histidinol-phosphatase n=1 Tax=Paenibacillus sp. KN14-4R TaxID=3445773 RepID=UPI003F9F504D
MKFDIHTHHERCGHAKGDIRQYIEAGLREGLDVIGISDHSPYYGEKEDQAYPEIAMAKTEFPRYVEEVLRLKEEYAGRIDVLLGVESDYFSEHLEAYRNVYEKYPFDYIIGSVHRSGGVSIFNRNRWKRLNEDEQRQHKEAYYNLIQQSAQCGLFQILGHIDAMKAYYPAFSDIQTPIVEETLKIIGANKLAIEVNTSGKTKDVGGWYPSDEMLEMALHYGVDITFGSDAHLPSRVGDEWELVRSRLKEIGFKEWVYFKAKKRVARSL